MQDCGSSGSFAHLWRSGCVNENWLLVHMNELSDEDLELIARQPREAKPTVVHCPGSHRYFGHSPFQWQQLQELGVNLCIATDSLASTESLSLLDELRIIDRAQPGVTPEQLLATVTVNPARALQRETLLGQIVPGAAADLIALPTSGRLESVHEEIVQHTEPIQWMMIDGQVRT
jgi:cytosine/adenosine deaminase-related metal-dependent hydrolase